METSLVAQEHLLCGELHMYQCITHVSLYHTCISVSHRYHCSQCISIAPCVSNPLNCSHVTCHCQTTKDAIVPDLTTAKTIARIDVTVALMVSDDLVSCALIILIMLS